MNNRYKEKWSAMQNTAYYPAAYFFFREKKLGKRSVANTQAKSMVAGRASKPPLPDLSGVDPDEVDDRIFLKPTEVRKGLQQVQYKYACTDAQLARACGAPNANAIGRFMNAGGEFVGKDQDMYPLGARFLEKLRVFHQMPKSKKRKAIESDPRPRRGNQPFLGIDLTQKLWVRGDRKYVVGKDECSRTVLKEAY
jgi:hypothetical protein